MNKIVLTEGSIGDFLRKLFGETFKSVVSHDADIAIRNIVNDLTKAGQKITLASVKNHASFNKTLISLVDEACRTKFKMTFADLTKTNKVEASKIVKDITNGINEQVSLLTRNSARVENFKVTMSPNLKSIVDLKEPATVMVSQKVVNILNHNFYGLITKVQKDMTLISNDILTPQGISNMNSLKQNITEINKLISTPLNTKMDAKKLIISIHDAKSQSQNLVNELTRTGKQGGISVAKDINTQMDDMVKNINELFKDANPSKSATKAETKVVAPEVKPGAFNTTTFTRDNYGRIVNNNQATFTESLLSKAFYEGFDKRNNMWSDAMISKLSPNTKSYLNQLYSTLESQNLIYTTDFNNSFKKLPQTVDEKIKVISGNHFGGFGRMSGRQENITKLPIPSSDVISDLMKNTMEESRQKELINLHAKLFK